MIYILNYKGKSFISRCIQAITWSPYSHTAIANEIGETIEAWHIGGVLRAKNPWYNHTPGTIISVYGYDKDDAWSVVSAEIGKKYDFRALLGFMPGLRLFWKDDPDKWFCSHLVAYGCLLAGKSLFSSQTPLYKISPGMIDTSPSLRKLGDVSNFKDYLTLISK